MARSAAIVQSAVFDAVNGIERHYTPVFVEPAAPAGASRRAAAVQAAYATLVKLYPSQQADLLQKRESSLASIGSDDSAENSRSIHRGIEWGQTVADAIWAWRSTDGFTASLPPFLGATDPGQWRPTPPALLPGVGVQFSQMTPWVMQSAASFRPVAPTLLSSERYIADFNEVKLMGKSDSIARTADQTLYSTFWNSATGTYFWNQVAVSLSEERNLTLSQKSRLLTLVNLAYADAGIGCFEAKYFYNFWRPVTAIPLAAADANPFTLAEASWTPLLVTPAFPEYPSGHACTSSAAARVLSSYFGENTSFFVGSDNSTMAGVIRFFPNFTAALQEVNNARVYGGIHFRYACEEGERLGKNVANYVLTHALLPAHGNRSARVEN
jgi:hypothetical protein